MEAPSLPEGCLEEAYKGNLRIRLLEFMRNDGSVSHLVEVAAWNSWAGQGKILDAVGGLDFAAAQELFQDLVKRFAGYDWLEADYVLEKER